MESLDETGRGVEGLLAEALSVPDADGEGESRALDAFRCARDSGALGAPTRGCDDWRRGVAEAG